MNDGVEQPARDGGGLGPGTGGDTVETLKLCQTQAAAFLDRLHSRILAAIDGAVAQLNDTLFPGDEEQRMLEELRMLQSNKEKLGNLLRDRFAKHYRDATGSGLAARRSWLAADPPGESGFSLVDDQQLEEWLAIDRLTGRIGDAHSGEIQGLTQRFRHLLSAGREGGEAIGCPLGPDKFCHAFHDVLKSLDVDFSVRVRCYELLSSALAPEIGAFYAEVNKLLVGRGVLPELRIEPTAQAGSRGRSRSRSQPSAREQGAAEESWSDEIEPEPESGEQAPAGGSFGRRRPASINDQMFIAMQHLLRAHFGQTGSGAPMKPGADAGMDVSPLPVTPMLIDTLSALQRDDALFERAGELIRGSGLREQVTGRFAAGAGTGSGGGDGSGAVGDGINRIDGETIEIVGMIFDYILDDRSLPDFMKALIGRLQIPVLKVAILDREFFSRKSHPVRQLLNEFSHAGLGWREESEAAKDRLYQKMETIVRRILEEFESDIAIFDDLLAEFRAFLEDEDYRFNEAQARLLKEAQENERRERITVRLAEELAKRLLGRDLPAEVREFLLTSWREYVTELLLEHGEESTETTSALTFVDDLLWSLQPKPAAEDRQRLIRMLPTLLASLQDGMRRIGYPEDEAERITLALQQRHFQCLKAKRSPAPAAPTEQETPATPVDAAPETISETTSETAGAADAGGGSGSEEVDRMFEEITQDLKDLSSINWDDLSDFDDVIELKSEENQHAFEQMMAEMGLELDKDEGPRVDDEHTELVKNLDAGTWVELTGADGETLRGKLAWKGDEYSSFSFVNRQYKVIAERPLYMLAEDFRLGRARVIEDVALFDRAVDGVISGLMRVAGGAGR